MSAVLTDEGYARVKWGGVWAGLITSLVTYLMLVVLGASIGLVAYDAGGEGPSARGVAIGAAIWLAICTLASAFLGGFVAARSAGSATTRSQGRYSGLLTGMMLLLFLSFLATSTIVQGVSSIFGMAGSLIGAGARAGGQAVSTMNTQTVMSRLGLQDEYQSVVNGFDRGEITRLVKAGAPDLNDQQASAATDAVSEVMGNARRNITQNLTNVNQIDDVLTQQVNSVQQQLSGGQFIGLLQSKGLSEQQARGVVSSISNRVTQLRDQGRQAMQQASAFARETADKAARGAATAGWTWLISAILILGAAFFGGGAGANEDIAAYRTERRVVRDTDDSRRVGNL